MPLRLPELLVLFVVALLIFGPKKLPEMGAAIGRSLTAFRKGWQEISGSVSEDAEIMDRRAELKRLELEALDREIAAKKASLLPSGEEVATANVTAENTEEVVYHTSAEEYSESTTIPGADLTYYDGSKEQPVASEISSSALVEPASEESGVSEDTILERTAPSHDTEEQHTEPAAVSKQIDEQKQDQAEQTGAAS